MLLTKRSVMQQLRNPAEAAMRILMSTWSGTVAGLPLSRAWWLLLTWHSEHTGTAHRWNNILHSRRTNSLAHLTRSLRSPEKARFYVCEPGSVTEFIGFNGTTPIGLCKL